MGVEVDEELGGEEHGEEGVDGVEGAGEPADGGEGGPIRVAGVEHVVVLGRDGVDDEVLPGRRARTGAARPRRAAQGGLGASEPQHAKRRTH